MAESFRNKPRTKWNDKEMEAFYGYMRELEAAGYSNRTEVIERANERMDRKRPIYSSVVSKIWPEYLAHKKKWTAQQVRKGNAIVDMPSSTMPEAATAATAANDAPALTTNGAPPLVVAQSAPPHIAPSASNPFPNAPLPGAAKPRPDYLHGVTSDGPPPPTFFDEVVSWAVMGAEDFVLGILDSPRIGPRIEQTLVRWRDIVIGNLEARELARDPAVFDERERGPRIVIAGFKSDLNERIKQMFKGRANIATHEQNKSSAELKRMLRGNYEKIDAVICARFMGHPAHAMVKAMMREKYFWTDGGLTTAVEKIERICVNWTSAQLAAHPRSGSMSAGSATGTH
jgi:hypothetical protein